jgi:hypothetical protein
MNIKTLYPILLLGAMLAHPSVQAADEVTVSGSQSRCAAGEQGCIRIAAADDQRKTAAPSDRQEICPKDAQDCDTRGKSQRDRAAAEMRDRHACRD